MPFGLRLLDGDGACVFEPVTIYLFPDGLGMGSRFSVSELFYDGDGIWKRLWCSRALLPRGEIDILGYGYRVAG